MPGSESFYLGQDDEFIEEGLEALPENQKSSEIKKALRNHFSAKDIGAEQRLADLKADREELEEEIEEKESELEEVEAKIEQVKEQIEKQKPDTDLVNAVVSKFDDLVTIEPRMREKNLEATATEIPSNVWKSVLTQVDIHHVPSDGSIEEDIIDLYDLDETDYEEVGLIDYKVTDGDILDNIQSLTDTEEKEIREACKAV